MTRKVIETTWNVPWSLWRFTAGVAIIVTGILSSAPTYAQSSGQLNEQLVQRLESLEKKLSRLQRQVNTGVPASSDDRDKSPKTTRRVPVTAVEAEARLSEAEEGLRQLNGKVENLGLGLAAVKKELRKLNKDLDLRLREIEKRVASSTNSVAENDGQNKNTGAAVNKSAGVTAGTTNATQGGGQSSETTATPVVLPKGDAKTQYAFAIGLMDKGDYGKAEQAFLAFIKANGADPLAGNAQYWLGETYYVREDYDRAARIFLQGFQKYPGSGKAPDNLLKLGKTMRKLNQKDKACAVLSELESRYPAASNTIRRLVQRERRAAGC